MLVLFGIKWIHQGGHFRGFQVVESFIFVHIDLFLFFFCLNSFHNINVTYLAKLICIREKNLYFLISGYILKC